MHLQAIAQIINKSNAHESSTSSQYFTIAAGGAL